MKQIIYACMLCISLSLASVVGQSKKEKREEDAKRGYMLLDTHEQPKNKKMTSQKYQAGQKKNQRKRTKQAKKVRKKQNKQPY